MQTPKSKASHHYYKMQPSELSTSIFWPLKGGGRLPSVSREVKISFSLFFSLSIAVILGNVDICQIVAKCVDVSVCLYGITAKVG